MKVESVIGLHLFNLQYNSFILNSYFFPSTLCSLMIHTVISFFFCIYNMIYIFIEILFFLAIFFFFFFFFFFVMSCGVVVVVVVFSRHFLLARAIRSARRCFFFTLPICRDSNGTYSFMQNPNHTED